MHKDILEKEFLDLVRENEGIIHKVINLYVDDKDFRKDVFQEILCQTWKSFKSFKGASKFSTWLYRISLNTVLNIKRKEEKSTIDISQKQEADFSKDDHEVLFAIVKSLDEIDKMLVTLHFDGYKNQEIAEITGMTSNHINVKLHRLKKYIIDQFKNYA